MESQSTSADTPVNSSISWRRNPFTWRSQVDKYAEDAGSNLPHTTVSGRFAPIEARLLYDKIEGHKRIMFTSGAARRLLGRDLWNVLYGCLLKSDMPTETHLVGLPWRRCHDHYREERRDSRIKGRNGHEEGPRLVTYVDSVTRYSYLHKYVLPGCHLHCGMPTFPAEDRTLTRGH